MRKHTFVPAVISIFLAAGLAASPQRAGKILSVPVSSADWDVASVDAIQSGQISAVRKASGEVLAIHYLSDAFRSGRKSGTKPAVFNGDYFLVANFDGPPPHSLGGHFGAFQGPPSTAQMDVPPGPDGQGAMVLTATREKDGWCGAWIHLMETNGEPLTREFLNGELFSHLVFWVRGSVPGPGANIKLADAAWYKKEDSVLIGPIASFLPAKKIEADWRLAAVPLDALPQGLDRRALATFVIEFSTPGSYRLEIKGLALANHPSALPSAPPKPRTASKATWIWNTEDVTASKAEQSALAAYLTAEGINRVFLNIPYKFGALSLDDAELGGLISLLRQKGILTEALFGDKELALPRNHAFVKNSIKDIIGYNSRAAAPARFAGVHLDIEPYLLRGFNSRKRGEILSNYLLILSEAAGLARSGKLEFGADIPPWFDGINEYSGEVLTAALGGKTKPVYEHVIDVCDQVTLMDYRTNASGVNGTIALAVGELAYAAKTKKKVFVGLETGPIEDERVFTFRGAPTHDPYAFPNAPFFVCISGKGAERTLSLLDPAAVADYVGRPGADGNDLWWPVYSAPEVPGVSISFAALGLDSLKRTASLTLNELSVYPSFAGIAVHDYVHYRKLLPAQ